MTIYVDELPKECFECPCFEGIETPAFCPCRLDFIENDKVQNYHKFDECNDNVCPLQSLTDYTKQVRKEVCEEVYKKCEPLFRLVNNYDNGDVIERNELVDILDQIQG